MSGNKIALWALALVAIVAALWYRGRVYDVPEPKHVHMALVTGGSGPYWQLIASGARDAAAADKIDLELRLPEAEENVDEQNKLLKELDLKNLDGVALSPLDAETQTPQINEIADDAVVITFDSDAPKSNRLAFVGTSNTMAGAKAARLVREAAPAGGKVAVVIANLTKDNMIERKSGFDNELAKPAADPNAASTYETLDYLIDGGDPKRCRELVDKALAENADLACLVGMNAAHGPQLAAALKDADKLGKVAIVAFDEEDGTIAGIEDGSIYATVVQDPYRYGYEAVRSMADLCRSDEAVRPLAQTYSTYSIATIVVNKDSVADFRKELASRRERVNAKQE